jgi:hypothetical protein
VEITEIRIKKDGKWYADGREMFRIPIVNLFATHLKRDETGEYYIHLQDETFPVVVEDVPFTVVGAYRENGPLNLVLHDEQEIELGKPIPLYFREGVPYLSFKWENDTRLSRSAFWMISNYLKEENGVIFLVPPSPSDDKGELA